MSGLNVDEAGTPNGAVPFQVPTEIISALMSGQSPEEVLRSLPKGFLQQIVGQAGYRLVDERERDVVENDTVVAKSEAQAQAPRRRERERERIPPLPAPPVVDVPANEADVEETNMDMLNDIGRSLGSLLGEMPGVALGITFEPGGRKVRVSAYYPQAGDYDLEEIAKKSGHVTRFGDALAVVFAEAQDTVNDESEELVEDDEDDLGEDEDDLDFEDGDED